jgi:hypothetical protein
VDLRKAVSEVLNPEISLQCPQCSSMVPPLRLALLQGFLRISRQRGEHPAA